MPAPPSRLLALCCAGWARGGWRCIAAALPFLLIAVSAALVLSGGEGLPGLARPVIGHLMRLEAYVFATGFFFTWCLMFPVFGTDRVPPTTLMLIILLLIVAGLSALMWTTRPGFLTVLQYWGLIAATYAGALLDRGGPARFLPWLQRTIWMIICYAGLSIILHPPVSVDSWSTQDSVMRLALAYFALLAFMELTGLYQVDWRRDKPAPVPPPPAPSPNPERERFAARLREFGARRGRRT